MPRPKNIHQAKTAEEVEAIAKASPGPVVLDFVAKGCSGCRTDAPRVRELAAACASATVIKVDVDQASKLADAWGVKYMPTLFVAENAAQLQPGKAAEYKNAEEAMAALRCPRKG